MFLLGTDEGWQLKEPADFKRFKIVLKGVSATSVPNLKSLQFDGDQHAWMDPSIILEMAGPVADAEWRMEFDRMLDFAIRHGWTNPEGWLRGHVEIVK